MTGSPRAAHPRPTLWGWGGVLLAAGAGGLSMPGLPGPAWLVWLAPLGLLAIAWRGLDRADASGETPRGGGRRLFGLGWLAGFGHFALSLHWLGTIAEAPVWAGALGVISLSAYLALYPALFVLLVARLLPRGPGLLVEESASPSPDGDPGAIRSRKTWWLPPLRNLAVAAGAGAIWTALELARDRLLTGFNWNGYHTPLIEQPVIAQAADLSGALALSFLPVFFAALAWGLVERLIHRMRRRLGPRPQLDLLVGAVMLALLVVHAIPRLRVEPGSGDLQLKAVALQPLLSQAEKWDPDPAVRQELHQLNLSLRDRALRAALELELGEMGAQFQRAGRAAGSPGQIDLLLLPESAYADSVLAFPSEIPHRYRFQPEGAAEAMAFTQPTLARLSELQNGPYTVISGVNLRTVDPDNPEAPQIFHNGLVRLASDGTLARYDKRHLVPFGEYLPLRPLFFFLEELIPWNFSAGAADQELRLPLREGDGSLREVAAVGLICFEDTVPRIARASVAQDPSRVLLLNATNDGWFSELAAEQHLAHARFRAIELRRPLLRAGNSGGTAAVDASGNLRDPWARNRLQLLEAGPGDLEVRGALFARLTVPDPTDPPMTPYLRFGNWFGWLSVGATIALILRRLRQAWRQRSAGGGS